MCIVFYTLAHPGYQLILISNRDEYLDRPAIPAAWHRFEPLSAAVGPGITEGSGVGWVLSGRDAGSSSGGTWLGMTSDLRIGVLTNIRNPLKQSAPLTPSRGQLLKDFLAPAPSSGLPTVHDYLQHRVEQADQYEGFNLLLFRLHRSGGVWHDPEIGYLSNKPKSALTDIYASGKARATAADIQCTTCGLSNSPLAMPWPKVVDGQARMADSLHEWSEKQEDEDALVSRMIAILQQTSPADHFDLSNTTRVQPMLVKTMAGPDAAADTRGGRWYGTRLSTVILVKKDGEVTFVERDISVLDGHGGVREGSAERVFHFAAVQ